MAGLLSSFVDFIPRVSNVSLFISFMCASLGFLLYVRSRQRLESLPPGPVVLPIVGNLFTMLTKDMHKTLSDLRKRYGDIFRLYIGNELVIVLNGFDVIHEALVKNGSVFADRPISSFHEKITDNPVLLTCNGKIWKDHRSFSQQTLKRICLDNGAQRLQEILSEEADYFLKEIDAVDESELDIVKFVNIYSLNVIFRIVYGYRFTYDDRKALYMTEAYHDLGMEFAKNQVIANCFYFLSKLPGDILNLNKFLNMREKLTAFLRTFNENPNHNYERFSNRLCDQYQAEVEKNENGADDEKQDFPSLNKDRIDNTCSELIGAASDTTANAIAWLILYLVRESEVQKRMYEEIRDVLGASEKPDLSDKTQLPYVDAVIQESLRISSSVPYALPHSVSKTVDFHGYKIPKGCTILVNLKSVLRDQNVFNSPNEFRPGRFFDSDSNETSAPKEFVPFSIGPRSCLGVSIAMKEMFLIITALVQKYELLPSGDLPDTDGILSTVFKPRPFCVKLKKRP